MRFSGRGFLKKEMFLLRVAERYFMIDQ